MDYTILFFELISHLEKSNYTCFELIEIVILDFDLIVANLPYIPTSSLSTLNKEVIDYEPLIALDGGEDGRLYIDKLKNDLKNIDSKELVLVLEVDTSHAESLLSSFTDWEDVKLEKDLVERSRYIVARK